jgi:hypothetical protein
MNIVPFRRDPPFIVSIFVDKRASTLIDARLTLPQLAAEIERVDAACKDLLPWLKLARFGTTRTRKGTLRHNANVAGITGAEADYDGERLAFEKAAAILKQARLTALLYTSPSHRDDKPRWRVLAPTSQELPPEERTKLVARLNGLFGGILARESFVLSQSYYYGSVGSNPAHRVIRVRGDYIDRRADLDAKAIYADPKPLNGARKQHRGAPHRAPSDREPIDWRLIVAALQVIPADDYWPWLKIGAALWGEFGDDGFDLFDRWSATSDKYDAEQCADKWHECQKLTQFTGATILFYANLAAPGWRQSYRSQLWQSMVKKYLRRR